MENATQSSETLNLGGQLTCNLCHRQFKRKRYLTYHLQKKVCLGHLPLTTVPVNPISFQGTESETLKLMIEYKKHEIELAKLQLELEKTKAITKKYPIKLIPKPITPPVPPISRPNLSIRLHNFGEENCIMLTDGIIINLIEKYSDENNMNFYRILSYDLLKLVHLNQDYPENHNIRQGDNTDELLVVHESQWVSYYYLTVIREYLRGYLFRIRQLIDQKSFEQIETSVVDNLEQLYQDFLSTLS